MSAAMPKALIASVLLLLAMVPLAESATAARLKDIVSVQGIRSNQLIGYGLVVGLKGTGDSLRNAPFTAQSIRSMLERMGVNVRGADTRTQNVAAVIVTAELPPFVTGGSRIDVTVSSLGDASSLAGGALVMTPLLGADQLVYAVAQGSVAVAGFSTEGRAASLTQGVPTTGRVANGAIVERVPPTPVAADRILKLELQNPDFVTAVNAASAINRFVRARRIDTTAHAVNSRTIAMKLPPRTSATEFLAQIGAIEVVPDTPARVVIDERTGTIVIGKSVSVSTVAVTHGNLTVRVNEAPRVSQPRPFTGGGTAIEERTQIDALQNTGNFAVVEGADLQTLVTGLNRMGLKPPGIIAILQAIKASGALQAELVVQ
jgi:flagellar P-ring protein FlgI